MNTSIKSSQVEHEGTSLADILADASIAPLSLETTFDPPSLSAGASTSQAFALTGAQLGDFVQVSFSNSLGGLVLSAYVSAPNQVTAVLHNITGSTADLSSGTIRFRLTRSS